MWKDRKLQIFGVFFSMQGRDSCRLNPATSNQEEKYAVYRILPFLLIVSNDTFLFSEEMVGLFDFIFVYVGHF